MSQHSLSAEETAQLTTKLREIRESVVKDHKTIQEQQKTIRERDAAIARVFKELTNIKKELMTSGGVLTEPEFRQAMRKYLLEIKEEVQHLRQHQTSKSMVDEALRVTISGAAGQIGYSLIPLFANGQALGLDQPIILTLLEIEPALPALNGVVMEMEDGAYPLVQEIRATADPAVAFKDCDWAILVGGFPRGPGMERKDLLAKNVGIFKTAGEALEKHAKSTCHVLVVANPANTNCLTCAKHAPKIPKENFGALTRLDMNRARAQIAKKVGVSVGDVHNVVIWGNHSSTQVPDVDHAHLESRTGRHKSLDGLSDSWVRGEFTKTVQQRGKAIIDARKFSSAMSAANAIKDCVRDWHFGTPSGEHVSMAVYSDGSYGVAKDIFYSFPLQFSNDSYQIVKGLKVSDSVKKLMKLSEDELLEEKKEAGF